MSIGLLATHNHQRKPVQPEPTNTPAGNGRIWNGAIYTKYKPSTRRYGLRELQSIKTAFRQNQPEISFLEVGHIPSFWTLSIYAILISTTMYILYTKISPKFCKTKTPRDQNTEIEMSRVQLPH
ncbi:hypothetical protein JTB14_019484 [Gonioctena quinquepunctata]|nr:hypothetical protein JTB14_019484 [Gonioctena quinquepunctata]